MFDEDEELFLERIPYPEALSREVIRQGEMWKLQANVEYIQSAVKQAEHEHEEAVQAAHDEHDETLEKEIVIRAELVEKLDGII